jgi:hypothetical protein
MSYINEIKDWVTGSRDYETGMELLRKYIRSAGVIKQFETNKDVKKLATKLCLHAGINTNLIRQKPRKIITHKQVILPAGSIKSIQVIDEGKKNQETPETDVPEEIKQLVRLAAELRRERIEIRKTILEEVGTENTPEAIKARKARFDRTVKITNELDRLNEYIDKYNKTGKIQEEKVEEEKIIPGPDKTLTADVILRKQRELNNVISNISKYKKKPKTEKNEKKIKALEKKREDLKKELEPYGSKK